MLPPALDTLDLIIAACVFGLILAAWMVVFFLWYGKRASRASKLEERMGLTDEEREEGGSRLLRLWHEGREVTTEVPGMLRSRSFKERLQRLVRDAELEDGQFRSLLLGLFGFGALLSLLLLMATGSVFPGLGLCVLLFLGFRAYLKWRVSRRLARFELQFVDALDLAARSLRAGHPLLGAFRLIAEETRPPVSVVFDEICQQQALGMSMRSALQRAAMDTPSPDVRIFATSVIIQLESGGNLADMMERIALVIRDRLRLSRRVRALTAQTQLSKRVLICLPILMFFILNVLNRDYMSNLYKTTEGQMLLVLAGAAMLAGTWTMNRLALLKY